MRQDLGIRYQLDLQHLKKYYIGCLSQLLDKQAKRDWLVACQN